MVRGFGMDMDTLLCLKWVANEDLLYSTCHVAAWIQAYVCLSPFGVHLKLS